MASCRVRARRLIKNSDLQEQIIIYASAINLTEVVDKAIINSCPTSVVLNANGKITYTGACIPNNATDMFQVECTNINNDIPLTVSCDYIFSNVVNVDPSYYCTIVYEQTSHMVASRGLSNYYIAHDSITMTGASSIIQSSFIFLALLITVIMPVNHNHL